MNPVGLGRRRRLVFEGGLKTYRGQRCCPLVLFAKTKSQAKLNPGCNAKTCPERTR